MAHASLVRELVAYARTRRKFLLFMLIGLMALIGGLLVAAQGSVLAPFIYTIF